MGASPTEVGGLRWARLALWSLALDETSPAQRIRAAPIAGVHALAWSGSRLGLGLGLVSVLGLWLGLGF